MKQLNSRIIYRNEIQPEDVNRFFKNLAQLINGKCKPDFFLNGLAKNAHPYLTFDLGGLIYSIYSKQKKTDAEFPSLPRPYRAAYFRNTHYNHILLEEAQCIFKLAKGLKVAAIQGIAHLILTYDDIGARGLRDMDFLVAREDMEPFVKLLESRGYTAVNDEAFFSYDYDGHIELRGTIGGHKILVDVSSYTRLPANLMTDLIRCRLDDILNQIQVTESGIAVVQKEYLALLTLFNLERKEYTSIKGWLDFVAMTNSPVHELNWQRFANIIKAPGARRIIKRQLEFCRDNFRAKIPQEIINQLSVPTGFADDGWLSFLMNPEVILNGQGRATNDMKRRPSFKSLLIGLSRRMIAFDFPDRERKWLNLVFKDSSLVVNYLYPTSNNIGKQLTRYFINPLIIATGYILGLIAHLCGGAYLYRRYVALPKALQTGESFKRYNKQNQCGES